MTITIQEVRKVFDDILDGYITREDADRWAYTIMQQQEAALLEYLPSIDEECIWQGIQFIYGIDIKVDEGGEYLHSNEDIIVMRSSLDKRG